MHVATTSFQSNPNVGLYGYATQKVCFLGIHPSEKEQKMLAEVLGVPIVTTTVAGTPMPGVFLAGNSHALIAPHIIFDKEQAVLEKHQPVTLIQTNLTCLGNNIIANDHGCLVNPEFTDEEIATIQTALKVPVKRMKVAGLDTPGACIVLNGTKGIIHRDAEPFEIDMAKQVLKLESLEPASVNLGSPYIRSGLLNNQHGFVVGDHSGGPEVVHIEESLGYLDG